MSPLKIRASEVEAAHPGWAAARSERDRRQGITVTAVTLLVLPLGWVLSDLLGGFGELTHWRHLLVVELVAALGMVLFVTSRSLGAVRRAHAVTHFAVVFGVAWAGPSFPSLATHAMLLSLFIFGPQATFVLPLVPGALTFFLPAASVAVTFLLRDHNEPLIAVAESVFYLCIAGLVCTVASVHRYAAEFREFIANEQLARAKSALEESIRKVVAAQTQLVQSEKMASLGQLVAGVAHELNTPLGALEASTGNLERSLEAVTSGGDEVPVDAELLAQLLERVAGASKPLLSSREERAARRALVPLLEAAGCEQSRNLAQLLVEAGLYENLEPLLPKLGQPGALAAVERAHTFASVRAHLETIRLATRRASRVVTTLRTYAHPGGALEEATEGEVAEHLDTVLRLHSNQLRDVTVERNYAAPGVLWARHDQLNQVWTNLIQNAVQAMSRKGRLRVSVEVHPDETNPEAVRVSVTDSGPGIPEDVQARIFEPFFTTKPPGEGSGLGLSICNDIVRRHGGRFEVSSTSEGTTITAILPTTPPEE